MNRKIIGVTVGTPINPNKFAPSDALRIDKTATDEKGLLIGQKGSALAEVITLGKGLKLNGSKLELDLPIYDGSTEDIDTITFSIQAPDAKEYYAISGMTWGDWVASEFNTDGYIVNTDGVVCTAEDAAVMYRSDEIKATDTITANQMYTYVGG